MPRLLLINTIAVCIAKNKLKPLKNRALTSHTSRGLASTRNERQVEEEETQKLLTGVVVIVGVVRMGMKTYITKVDSQHGFSVLSRF